MKAHLRTAKIRRNLLTVVAILFVILPLVWVVDASFQRRMELFAKPPTLIPSSFYLENYRQVLSDPVVIKSLGNSLMVSMFATLVALILGSLAAYSFVRLPLKFKNQLFLLILGTQMLPSISLLIPLYLILRNLGLVSTYQGLIISYVTFTLPYVIWLLRSYFMSIPADIEEQAMVDGCSRLGAIRRIVLPLSMNGFLSTAIFSFIGAWNEFMMASILTNNATRTFPVRLAMFIGEETTSYEHMFSAAVIGIIPVIVVVILFQPLIVRGLTEGGVKQ
jgi:multiple sugar transport system permease protein